MGGIAALVAIVGFPIAIVLDMNFSTKIPSNIVNTLMVIYARTALVSMFTENSADYGTCPYCSLTTKALSFSKKGVVQCTHCSNKSVQRDGKLNKIEV